MPFKNISITILHRLASGVWQNKEDHVICFPVVNYHIYAQNHATVNLTH